MAKNITTINLFKNPTDINYQNIGQIILLFLMAIICALMGDYFNLPISWLLLPMVVAIVWTIVKGEIQYLPKSVNITGQVIIAIFTASRFTLDTLTTLQHYIFPLLICIVITGSFSLLNGYIMYKLANIDIITSFLGCIPGASASLVAMSEDMGADGVTVAILQYIRIFMVSLIMPIIASFYPIETSSNSLNIISSHNLLPSLPFPFTLTLITLCVVLGIKLGKMIKLPSNSFLAPFFSCVLLFCFLPYQINLPSPVFQIGLLLVGLSIKVTFDPQILLTLTKAVFLQITLVFLLIGACVVTGYGFHLITKIDTMTALLGSTPGGLNAMMATVVELGGNSSFVLTMQMTRMLLILTLSPFVATTIIAKI